MKNQIYLSDSFVFPSSSSLISSKYIFLKNEFQDYKFDHSNNFQKIKNDDNTNKIVDNYEIDDKNQEIMNTFHLFVQQHKIPPLKMKSEVLKLLKKEFLNALINENYAYSSKIDKLINELVQNAYKKKDFRQINKNKKIDHKIRKAQKKINKIDEKHNAILRNFLDLEETKLIELKRRQEKELSQFKELWASEDSLIPYDKPSPTLIELRKLQKTLALSKRFTESETIKKEVEALQQKEQKKALLKANESYQQSFNTLKYQHKKELQCFEDHRSRVCSYLNQQRDAEKIQYINMYKFYKRQQDERTLPNGKPSSKLKINKKVPISLYNDCPHTETNIIDQTYSFKQATAAQPLGIASIYPQGKRKK